MLKHFRGNPLPGRLIYRRSERSFDLEPRLKGGFAALLINDVQIEIDEGGRLLYVWGLCPYESWTPGTLDAPEAKPGRLQHADGVVTPGTSKRLNGDKRWPVSYDVSSGWLCIGDISVRGETIAFAPDAIAALKDGGLAGLWLHPDMRA